LGKITDGVKAVNSAVRTLLLSVLVGLLGYGGYLGYSELNERDRILQAKDDQIELAQQQLVSLQDELTVKSGEIQQLGDDLREKLRQIEKLETSLHLLKTDQRLAVLNVLEVTRDESGRAVTSELEFIELSPTGDSISAPRKFSLPGDIVYIDNWIIKFDDSYIEQGDIERGTSLCLFRRIFSEQQTPNDGVPLDEVGMRPQAYARGGRISEFEQMLWNDFWEFANNPQKAADMGIRAANGEAVAIQVREGMSYNITLRSSGGLSINAVAAPVDATNASQSQASSSQPSN
jgi:hypothetical protein